MLGSVRLIHLLWSSQSQPTEQEKPVFTRSIPAKRISPISASKLVTPSWYSSSFSSSSSVISLPTNLSVVIREDETVPELDFDSIPSTPAQSESHSSWSSQSSVLNTPSTPITPFSFAGQEDIKIIMSPKKSHAVSNTTAIPTTHAAKKSAKSNKIAPIPAAHETLTKEIVEEEKKQKDVKRKEPVLSAHRFEWKNGGKTVKLTGTFDNWEETVVMNRSPDNQDLFWANVDLDHSKKNLFKFIVDGRWRCTDEFETEYDSIGNLNNILPI